MHERQHPADRAATGLSRRRGYTLVELLVAVAIIAILTAIAVPSFQSAFLNTRLTSYANEFVATAMLARSTAINQNAPVRMCQSSNGTTCGGGTGWESGYLLVCTSNNGNVCTNTPAVGAGTLVLKAQEATVAGWKITAAGAVSAIEFKPTGTGATPASLTICRSLPSAGNSERVVRVTPTGRTTVAKTSTGTCT